MLSVYIAKYVDDMTMIDTVDNSVKTDIDSSSNKPSHTVYPDKTQEAFNIICERAQRKGLKINDKKTAIYCV